MGLLVAAAPAPMLPLALGAAVTHSRFPPFGSLDHSGRYYIKQKRLKNFAVLSPGMRYRIDDDSD